jgi:hypothetical protein
VVRRKKGQTQESSLLLGGEAIKGTVVRKAGFVIQTIHASGPKIEPATYHKHTMPVQGKVKPHDNMPPYHVSAFIMRL